VRFHCFKKKYFISLSLYNILHSICFIREEGRGPSTARRRSACELRAIYGPTYYSICTCICMYLVYLCWGNIGFGGIHVHAELFQRYNLKIAVCLGATSKHPLPLSVVAMHPHQNRALSFIRLSSRSCISSSVMNHDVSACMLQ
jgi:hypothetical protein